MPVGRLDTRSKFFIDLGYWERQGRNFREELYDALCDDCKRTYSLEERHDVDHVDPVTAEVKRIDALWDCAMEECAGQPDYVTPKMPLQRAIFRAFIAAGNQPQSAEELFTRIRKGSPQIILKELLSTRMEEDGITPL